MSNCCPDAVASARFHWAVTPSLLALLLCLLAGNSVSQSAAGPTGAHLETRPTEGVPLPQGSWRFIVAGDSRNCGDIVLPAIAADSGRFVPSFYWHLGDLRAIYKIDEDMAFAAAVNGEFLNCAQYLKRAWPDFIEHQIAAFGAVPFYLGIGNHEVIPPKDELQFRHEFAAWLDQFTIRSQREKEDADSKGKPSAQGKNDAAQGVGEKDKTSNFAMTEIPPPTAYYHWLQGKVDFIYLDNASDDFGTEQLTWLARTLGRDKANPGVKSVAVGMHESLPDSIANYHSMGESKNSQARPSGEQAYKLLLDFRDQTHKPVYVLSSHSHFYMENIYDTPELKRKGQPLPGWIVGTGGAQRHALPANAPATAKEDVYGYLVGSVAPDGTIQFEFQEVHESDVPLATRNGYPATLVHWCFAHNSQNIDPDAEDITPRCVAPASAGAGH